MKVARLQGTSSMGTTSKDSKVARLQATNKQGVNKSSV